MNFKFTFKENCLISLALNDLKLSLINIEGKPFCAANLLNANNRFSDDSVGTSSRWILQVAAQAKIRI